MPINNKSLKNKYEIKPTQSIELLKELYILTRDGKLNQDSKRKLKQIFHLFQFIEPLLIKILANKPNICLVDHGAGKSYLGFILYDLFFKEYAPTSLVYGVEYKEELVLKSQELADRLGFNNMRFIQSLIKDSINSTLLPPKIDIVTALHACDYATDEVIDFAIHKQVQTIVLIPCCQAEIARVLNKNRNLSPTCYRELYRYPIHAREFGAHLTNVLRVLRLEAAGYKVQVTEFTGLEHSLKNELIIATNTNKPNLKAKIHLKELILQFNLADLAARFQV